jgi:glycosyltransferase involved in cell wall biosynthesis
MSPSPTQGHDTPLVTFALFAYNQEQYVRDAIEGAFRQTYTPLEIILSDDCSSDGTFAIMRAMSSQYAGKHNIILNRNSKNLGLALHVDRVHRMSSGDVIVHAAGDDVSKPERVERIMAAFLKDSERPSLIESNAELIDENSCHIGLYQCVHEVIRKRSDRLFVKLTLGGTATLGGGSTYAIHRSLIDFFEPPLPGILVEDTLINIRAGMLDGCLYIPDPLVKYRIWRGGLWNQQRVNAQTPRNLLDFEILHTKSRILTLDQAILDAKRLSKLGVLSPMRMQSLLMCLQESRAEQARWLTLCDGTLSSSTKAMVLALTQRGYVKPGRWLRIYVIRWVPFVRRIKNIVLPFSRNSHKPFF